MGLLESLNQTFKHGFVFRHEVDTLADLNALLPPFQHWYEEQRLHNSLGYRTPAAVEGRYTLLTRGRLFLG